VSAYDLHAWAGFLGAVVGAGAALAGLIFVALSINLARLIVQPKLAARAGETLAVLLLAVLGAALGLMPVGRVGFGVTLLAVATPVWGITLVLQLRQGPDSPDDPYWWFLSRVAVTLCTTLPLMLAGVSMIVGKGGGLFWLAGGVLVAFAGSVYNGWILLVEVVRNERTVVRSGQVAATEGA
jgi:modulator of FtsH protease